MDKVCAEEGCKSISYYNYPGERRKYCRLHKKENMISVVKRNCISEGCLNRAMYGIDKPRYCKEHKTAEMLIKTKKECKEEGCTKQASCGGADGIAVYCGEHKKDTMKNVTSKRCSFEGCKKVRPTYGILGKSERYCDKHKKEGMVEVLKKIEPPKCKAENCKATPLYNIKGEKAKYCNQHRTKEMINVVSKRCLEENCNKFPSFDIEGGYGKYCSLHKKEGMINVRRTINKKKEDEQCIACNLLMKVNKAGYCEYCNPQNARKFLVKQTALFEYLDARGLEGFQSDSIIENGKFGKERPDRIYKLEDKIIVLECDENQHKARMKECEETRMLNIGQCFNGLPVYFVRWNPDNYKCIGSPERIGMRHKILGDLIDNIQLNKVDLPRALVSVFYMYYDNWDGITNTKWNILMPFYT